MAEKAPVADNVHPLWQAERGHGPKGETGKQMLEKAGSQPWVLGAKSSLPMAKGQSSQSSFRSGSSGKRKAATRQ